VYGDLSQPITCGVCKESPPRWGRFFALTRYAGVSKRWVRDYKFHDARYLERDFRKLIGAKSSELSAFLANALLVPVPLHPLKEFLRGFNQSERLAKLLLEVSPTCAYEAQLLRRTRYTRQQAKLKRRERQKNVKKAFDINRKMPLDTLQSRRVVVVDDLLTTGSTVSACVQALKDAGFTTVDVLTFARV